jgi:hypothetical protein
MNDSTGSNVVSAIGAIGALGIEAYQLSQGQQVSTTLGPGGASVIQSGPAQTQTSLLLIVVILALVAGLFLLLRK